VPRALRPEQNMDNCTGCFQFVFHCCFHRGDDPEDVSNWDTFILPRKL